MIMSLFSPVLPDKEPESPPVLPAVRKKAILITSDGVTFYGQIKAPDMYLYFFRAHTF